MTLASAPPGAPLVSVIMPAYNAATTVLESVESVQRQTLPDWELIVLDDGSTDETADLVAGVGDARLRLVRAPHSGLPARCRNHAGQLARGSFVAFLDSDDLWLPRKLETQIEAFGNRKDLALVHTAVEHLMDGTIVAPASRGPGIGVMDSAEALHHLLARNFIYTSSVMLRRQVLDHVGWFDPDPAVRGVEDFDLWLRLCESRARFGYVDEPLLRYRVRPDSLSRDRTRDLRCTLRVLEKALDRDPGRYRGEKSLLRRRRHHLYRELGICQLLKGEPGGGTEILRSLRFSPLSPISWAWLLLGLLGSRGILRVLRWRRALVGSVLSLARRDRRSS